MLKIKIVKERKKESDSFTLVHPSSYSLAKTTEQPNYKQTNDIEEKAAYLSYKKTNDIEENINSRSHHFIH